MSNIVPATLYINTSTQKHQSSKIYPTMDHITNSDSLSSTSSSSSSKHSKQKPSKPTRKSYTDSLHSVQKPAQKSMITKQFIAPLPPTPQKVYKVKSSNFKQLVRMLTTSPEFQSPPLRRLKDIAPPPLTLSTIPKPYALPSTLCPNVSTLLNETLETNRFVSNSNSPVMKYFGSLSPLGLKLSPQPSSFDPFGVAVMSPLGLNLSPSSLSWFSSLLMSPANLSGFNQSTII